MPREHVRGGRRAPIEGHVPVEHRWLGLDRRTFPLAAVVLAIVAVFLVVLPAIDDAVAWDDEIEAGDVLTLGQGITFVPPVGWQLVDGIRVGGEPIVGVSAASTTAAIGNGGVAVQVVRSGFDGTPDELLDQENRLRERSDAEPNRSFAVTGPRSTITTRSGLAGVSEAYTSAAGEGRMLAFTLLAGDAGTTPTGIIVTIDGTAEQYAAQSEAIAALVDSLSYQGAGS
jgi:hypothetical protein